MGKAKILVVDDEVDILNLARIIFETEGYEVQTTSNHLETFSKIAQDRPDLILLDIKMPKMDGYEICRKLRKNPETATVPIVMFSASSNEHTSASVREAGADGFILKPFTIKQLLGVVKKHLGS